MATTMKGPGIFLAQFAGDAAPFNSLPSIAKWAGDLGYKGVQIPTWDGRLFDCDFNQMLELECELPGDARPHISEFDPALYAERRVRTARHCYGCTAGAGSSCGGATV